MSKQLLVIKYLRIANPAVIRRTDGLKKLLPYGERPDPPIGWGDSWTPGAPDTFEVEGLYSEDGLCNTFSYEGKTKPPLVAPKQDGAMEAIEEWPHIVRLHTQTTIRCSQQ